jgi:hypothetical protein
VSSDNCPQLGCGETTYPVLVEEGDASGEVRLYSIRGVRWCPNCGITELEPRAKGLGPRRLGRFLKLEYPPRGQRVWHVAGPGEENQMMSPANPTPTFFTQIAYVRWDHASGKIVPLGELGPEFYVKPETVNLLSWSTVPPEV